MRSDQVKALCLLGLTWSGFLVLVFVVRPRIGVKLGENT